VKTILLRPFLANANSGSRSLFAVACPCVCLSSVVCNVRAPYSGGSNVPQYFYGIRYLGHPLTSTENFMEIVPGNPGQLNTRGVIKLAISDLSMAISRKRCKRGGKLVLITNRKLYMSFQLVPKSVTMNDLEWLNGRYFALFSEFR